MAWDAREFFDTARAAAMEAERIRAQLADMDERTTSLGGTDFQPRVRSTPDPDAIGRRLAAAEEHRARLTARQDECYRIVDAACALLYGTDSDAGLWSLVGWPADAIYHHYLALRTWDEVAALMLYSTAHVRREAYAALDLCTANGAMWTRIGMGFAEDARL